MHTHTPECAKLAEDVTRLSNIIALERRLGLASNRSNDAFHAWDAIHPRRSEENAHA